jgi:hypothetical protein
VRKSDHKKLRKAAHETSSTRALMEDHTQHVHTDMEHPSEGSRVSRGPYKLVKTHEHSCMPLPPVRNSEPLDSLPIIKEPRVPHPPAASAQPGPLSASCRQMPA